MENCQHWGPFSLPLASFPTPCGGGIVAPAIAGMESPALATSFYTFQVLPFPYPGSPRGDLPTPSTCPALLLQLTPHFPAMPPFSSAPLNPGNWSAGPMGLLPGLSSFLLNRFLLYKHTILVIYTHELEQHMRNQRRPFSLIPLGTAERRVSPRHRLT